MSKQELLLQLGECWRGDWSDFDGWILRDQLEDWALLEETTEDIDGYRRRWRMCLKGQSHWAESCKEYHALYRKYPELLSHFGEPDDLFAH